ncbi:MAG: hypothetical protein PHV82_06300 [Victivallaceae bacterium]|nr:hypothetical protein [Victivallaceae bacterium]
MKRHTAKVLLITFSALAVVFLLLVRLSVEIPAGKPMPAGREIEVDLIVEKGKTQKHSKPAKPPTTAKPKPEPGKAPATSPSATPVSEGALPPVSVNYREQVGFRKYAEEMGARGAKFYIIGNSKKQIYEIDFDSKSLRPAAVKTISSGNFSPRTRIIEDEPALQFFLDKAQNEFGIGTPQVILLVPQQIEDKIAAALAAAGINAGNFRGFRGTYLMNSGTFILKIHEGITSNGKQSLNIAIAL